MAPSASGRAGQSAASNRSANTHVGRNVPNHWRAGNAAKRAATAHRDPPTLRDPPMPTAAARARDAQNPFFSPDPRRGRPRAQRHDRPGAGPPADRDRADRVGEHRLARRARGRRLGDDQQVCRRLSRQALLRWLPVRRRGRDTGHRARRRSCSAQTSPTSSRPPAAR